MWPFKKENKREKITIIVIVIVVIIAVAIGYLLLTNKNYEGSYYFEIIDTNSITQGEVELLDELKQKAANNSMSDQDLVNLALIQKHSANFDEGIEILLQAYKMNSDNVLIMNNLGDLYSMKKDYLKSEEWYLKSVTKSPTWINGYQNLYQIYKYHLKDKLSSFPELIERGIELDVLGQDRKDMYILLGNYYLEQEQNKEALEYYQKALDLDPNNEDLTKKVEELKS